MIFIFLFSFSSSRLTMTIDYSSTYGILDSLKQVAPGAEQYQNSFTYLIFDKKDKNKSKYVLKTIDLEQMTNITEFIKNILWYKQLNHTNLMSIHDCFLLDTKLYLIKPYASLGSCSDLLTIHSSGIREQLIAHIIWQLLQALRYLHDRHIMHRSVSSKNIFLFDNGRVLLDNFSNCISMISPFDGKLRRQIYDYTDNLKDEILYLAPEVIYQNADGYNFKSDVYSLGTVACELANGSNSYIDMPHGYLSMLYAKIRGSEPMLLDQTSLTEEMIALSDESSSAYVEEIRQRRHSKEFHSFVKSCVGSSVEFRSSIDDLCQHSFVKPSKKITANSQLLADDFRKYLGFSKQQEQPSHSSDTVHNQIFSDDSKQNSNSINVSWDF